MFKIIELFLSWYKRSAHPRGLFGFLISIPEAWFTMSHEYGDGSGTLELLFGLLRNVAAGFRISALKMMPRFGPLNNINNKKHQIIINYTSHISCHSHWSTAYNWKAWDVSRQFIVNVFIRDQSEYIGSFPCSNSINHITASLNPQFKTSFWHPRYYIWALR